MGNLAFDPFVFSYSFPFLPIKPSNAMRHRSLLLAGLAGLAAVTCGRAQQADPVGVVRAFPALTFNAPVDLQAMPGTNRLCVVEQSGRILSFENRDDVDSTRVLLDIRSRVRYSGEMGLLGLAFDPQFVENRTFYVFYVAENPRRNILSRFMMVSGSADSADTASEQVLLTISDPYDNHNGGQIRFGADGYLYIGTGDGGSGGDPQNRAQNRDSLLGKLLRIDVHGTEGDLPYAIPASNPYASSTEGYRREIYAYGLRNPWRWSFDPHTPSNIWIADVGQGAWEEIDVLTAPGQNFGWKITEGRACYSPSSGCDTTGITMPVWQYGRDMGQSITGGFVYRGSAVPALVDRYVYADFVSGRIWSLRLGENGSVDNTLIADTDINASGFGEDHAGELFFTAFFHFSADDGRIYRFTTTSGVEGRQAASGVTFRSIVPNPARDRAVLRFALGHAADVAVTLHDPLGRAVRTVAERRMESGEHELPIDLSGLPAGQLFLRLRAGENTVARAIERQ